MVYQGGCDINNYDDNINNNNNNNNNNIKNN